MAYNLGAVKPHVAAAANHFGPAHRISTIGGWRAQGSVPNSDHPKGLALDFMTGSKAQGDSLAADLIENYKKWGIKYVIWWRQIWTPGKGWQPYDGPSPHTDHVHGSFNAKPGDQSLADKAVSALVPDSITAAVAGVADQLKSIGESVASVGKVAELLTRLFLPTNIIRGAAGLAGTAFILIGLWFLSREIRNS